MIEYLDKAHIRSCASTFSYDSVKESLKVAAKNSSSNSNSDSRIESTTTTRNDERFIAGAQQLSNQLRNPTVDVTLTKDTKFASDLVDQIQSSLDSEEGNKVNADEVKVGFIVIIKCRTV